MVGFAVFYSCSLWNRKHENGPLFMSKVCVSKCDVFAKFCYRMGLEYFRNSKGERLQILIDSLFFLSTLIYVGI